jgi:hypothetical protein
MNELQNLHNAYVNACNNYVKAFSEKQDLTFENWVGDNTGTYANFEEGYCFSIDEIIFDLQTKQPEGNILRYFAAEKNINYPAFCGKAGFWRDKPLKSAQGVENQSFSNEI